jgi:hypothetical protein
MMLIESTDFARNLSPEHGFFIRSVDTVESVQAGTG